MLEGNGFKINESKFDYFFGRVNRPRSRQNLKDLNTLGISADLSGQKQLMQIFEQGLNAAGRKPKVNEYGVTIPRRVQISGVESSGEIEVGYFYRNGDLRSTPEITTIIPIIHHQKPL